MNRVDRCDDGVLADWAYVGHRVVLMFVVSGFVVAQGLVLTLPEALTPNLLQEIVEEAINKDDMVLDVS